MRTVRPDRRIAVPEPAAVSISRRVAAPAAVLFARLARPADHRAIDGSGLVRSADPEQVLRGVGDVFRMRMRNEMLGHYVTENHVVEFVLDRRIAWEPVLVESDHPDVQTNLGVNAHLRWRWELEPQPDGTTLVTESYDLSRCPDWLHEATSEGEYWREAIEASLANLAALVEGAAELPR